jgi:hypothetical protein
MRVDTTAAFESEEPELKRIPDRGGLPSLGVKSGFR